MVLGAAQQGAGGWCQQQRHALVEGAATGEAGQQLDELVGQLRRAHGADVEHQLATFLHLQLHIDAGRVLLAQLVAITGVDVLPGLDTELRPTDLSRHQAGAPAVVAQGLQRHTLPVSRAEHSPLQRGRQLVMAISEDHRTHRQGPPADAFGGETSALHLRRHGLDGNPWLLGGFACRSAGKSFCGMVGQHCNSLLGPRQNG